MSDRIVLPFPVEKRQVLPATRARSTVLCSSLKVLRDHGHIDAYYAALEPSMRPTIEALSAGLWVPIHLAMAHYEACDALNLSTDELEAIGADAGSHGHGTVAGTAGKLAGGVGVSPWAVLERADKVWDRSWQGSAIAVFKVSLKDARIEIAGWPCARFRYCRYTVAGVIKRLAIPFCGTVFIKPIADLCTSSALGYRVQWA